MAALPLFPIGGVLVPAELMALQLFESRYLRLHADLMSRPPTERHVGVIHIVRGHEVGRGRQGVLAGIGCVGLLRDHRKARVENRQLISWLLEGVRRFRLTGLDETACTPYLTGRVELLTQPNALRLDIHALAVRAALAVADRQALLEIDDDAELGARTAQMVRTEQALRQRFGGRPGYEPVGGDSLS